MDPDEHDGIEHELRDGWRSFTEGSTRAQRRRLERESTVGRRWAADDPVPGRDAEVRTLRGQAHHDHRQADRERYDAQLDREGARGLSRETAVEAEQHVDRRPDEDGDRVRAGEASAQGVDASVARDFDHGRQAGPQDELSRHHAQERSLWDSSARREGLADRLDRAGVGAEARAARLDADRGQAHPASAAVRDRATPARAGSPPGQAPAQARARVRPARRSRRTQGPSVG
ncbi:hypothetical protein PZ938_13170 [Luteipulveratus sp. YIM 133132]|uniref:Uncharacterized protein n=1 Tax=Luteipulveratus flavus TaxID=3031728 RepID=A0ABT6C3H1_9MICO|nr:MULTISPECIES: hypothetical protein [unclassified Luteipulveratus]MDE9366557.1 hypothetical protein [Luteipulveratus sp. YIM 133132]MDF8263508.1 hypothetical protein [Luteipulveratus sp. YIM 133296]